MAYATPEELGTWMGKESLTTAETARATLLLGVASGEIDDATGQSLLEETRTVDLHGSGTNRLVLPRWPVTGVAQVLVDGVALVYGTDFTWDVDGILWRKGGPWCRWERVTVTFTAGFDPVPESVKGLCLELASGAWSTFGGKTSERIADYQVAYAREGMALSTQDKNKLARYSANR